ncbi:MAG TPA: hypothetical protein PLV42_01060 [bacterium]|nr:hypothetical protein [bacterium]
MRPLLSFLLIPLLILPLDAAPKKKKEEKPRPACLNCHTNPKTGKPGTKKPKKATP